MPGRWLYGTLLAVGYLEVVGARHVLPDGRVLLDDVNFRVGEGSKAALVGANGAGKTTLLRLIAGDLSPQAGTRRPLRRPWRDAPVHRLGAGRHHRAGLPGGLAPTPVREAWAAVRGRRAGPDGPRRRTAPAGLRARPHALGRRRAATTPRCCGTPSRSPRSACRTTAASTASCTTLSGGEQKRLALEALLRGPDEVLLLDEPDNYLDVPGKRWLEDRLRETPKTVLFVSHDRELLAQVADRIVTVEGETAWVHGGGFASYHEARSAKHERMAELRRRWEEEHARLKELVRTLQQQAKVSEAMAAKYRVMVRRLERFEAAGPPPDKPTEQRVTMRLRGGRTGVRAVICERLGAHRAHATVRHRDLLRRAGRRSRRERRGQVALPAAARRRAGRRVRGMAARARGSCRAGSPRRTPTRPGWPGRSSTCSGTASRDETGSTADARWRAAPVRAAAAGRPDASARCPAGSRRASRSCCSNCPGRRLLLLDEPTDNLDVLSAEALEEALDAFDGTVLAVTHDRWFARSFDRFLVFGADGAVYESDEPVFDEARVNRPAP